MKKFFVFIAVLSLCIAIPVITMYVLADDDDLIEGPCGHNYHPDDADDHQLQASCPVNITQNGGLAYCTVSSYYECIPHTHVFPTVDCGRAACEIPVTDQNDHRATCINGHEYWTCNSTKNEYHKTRNSCVRKKWKAPTVFEECGETWARCDRRCRDMYNAVGRHKE